MHNSVITALQLFSIGFSFGIAGQCIASCTPVILTYLCATKKAWFPACMDICVFLTGRFLAYIVLGFLTGLGLSFLRQCIDSRLTHSLRFAGGLVTILMGLSIVFFKEKNNPWCRLIQEKTTGFGSLCLLGFIAGISPCVPLVTLLTEVALMSKNIYDSVWYAFSFACGISFATFLVLASLGAMVTWLPKKIIKSKISEIIFKIICSILLIMLGMNMAMKHLSR